MAKDPTKSIIRGRTEALQREIEDATSPWRRPLRSGAFAGAVLIWAVFMLAVWGVVLWTKRQPLIEAGRVVRETRTVEAAFQIIDEPATDQARSAARQRAARVYVGAADILNEVTESLENLPRALRDVETLQGVDPTLRQQFGLTDESLAAVRQQMIGDQISDRWTSRVGRLSKLLERTPLLDNKTYQVEVTTPNDEMELRTEGRPTVVVRTGLALDVESSRLSDDMRQLAAQAGFSGLLLDVVASRLTSQPRPTFAFDSAATAAKQQDAAAKVAPVEVVYPVNEVIVRRGEVVSPSQLAVLERAMATSLAGADPRKQWIERGAFLGLVGAVALALAGYTVLFVPRIRRSPARTAGVAGVFAGGVVLACWGSATFPGLIAMTALGPTVLVAVLMAVAYDQRVAIAYGALHGILVCVALGLPVAMYAVIVAGVGVAVWRLREVRDRDAIIKMGLLVALALGGGVFVAGLVGVPITRAVLAQAGWDAGLAAFCGLVISGVTLFILPMVERWFDITTGMTLVELRDPKNPLLRQLQQRAPGTYNHSLNLASLGEAAAEAVGANGLLTYVGALYHDIGKMNKPEYFVENQTPGFNRHDKLSPAMSLLVIVGHVKDGMELAREFNLPQPLWHFIESHHGTTLVEYFYHRARRQAEQGAAASSGDAPSPPSELEYRYPGPKPRTKEAAIVMLCDAVESAARAMAEPTPSRIDALVRAIATKRLMDGQFDESDLTLRELNMIVETVSKTLAAIYHGRIAYPAGGDGGQPIPPSPSRSIERPTSAATSPAQVFTSAKRG
jgi:cyclic-di-AMP phosphodiesterase PgpH